jgi:L-Ala-D/L-Glu epimerase
MKIASADVFAIKLPFRFAFKHSLASRSSSENIIVKVELVDGSSRFTGFGEGIPRDYVTGETVNTSIAAIQKEFLPPLLGLDFADERELMSLLTTQFFALGLDHRALGAAWCALELALLDAMGQAKDVPLTNLLGGICAHANRGIRYGGVIPFGGKRSLLAVLLFYKCFGFKTVKLKVGDDLDQDLANLQLARKILGDQVILRVDANCAWTFEKAMMAVKQMRTFKVSSYEQPLPADDLEGLAKLTRAIPEQVVADESLCTVAQAKRLAAEKIVSAFNIRLSKVGGILAARQIADIASQAGLAVHLGAQVGESGILSAAARAFAASRELFDNYEGSNNFFLLKNDITDENLNVGWGGLGKVLTGKGLGVTVSANRLNNSSQAREMPRPQYAATPMVKQ